MRTFDGFFDILGELDWLAIIVATLVVYVVIGALLYGPLLGKQYAAASGFPYEGMKWDTKRDIPALILAFLFQIGVAYLGAYDDIEHSLVTALVVGLYLFLPILYSRVIWLKGSRTAFLLDFLYLFLAVAVGGYVQGLFA
jgi:hypothetical protein